MDVDAISLGEEDNFRYHYSYLQFIIYRLKTEEC